MPTDKPPSRKERVLAKNIKKMEKVKIKEVTIHWAEGDNSNYDEFPKTYETLEKANKAIIPIYEDIIKDGFGGYNKVKFTILFEDNETYEGRLEVCEKYDNPTKTENVIGKHIEDFLVYNYPNETFLNNYQVI
jgi:hypothetical protein